MTIFSSRYADLAIRDQTITERVFEGLASRPDEVVVIDGPTGRSLTAAKLMADIKSFAGGLTARGLGKGHMIALMAPNIPEFCTVFHGAAWAGATVTPINPTYTEHEVRHQLINSAAEILITVPQLLDTVQKAVEGTDVSEIVVIGDAAGATPLTDLMGAPLTAQAPVDLDEHVAVLPFSSGTTGLPKGVMLTHRNLVANTDQILAIDNIKPGEITPAFLPFFHIYGLMIFVCAYLAGHATIATLPRFDLELFLTLTEKHKSRALWVVPPVAIALAKHPMIDKFDLSAVELVNSAAAPLGAELGLAVADRLKCAAIQAYGMTELSPATHVVPCTDPRPGSCGIAVPNTSCRIVDVETGADLDANHKGELWVKGPQVMKGYLNNPQATRDMIDGDGWLRTGDIGYIDGDGYLFIVDRLKELIKYKGFQVAPAEIEAQLVAHPKIADAAVIGVPDDEAGELPMAFVVPAPDQRPEPQEITEYLAERLAHYKQVHRIDFVEEIPKSASGKILRRILRDQITQT